MSLIIVALLFVKHYIADFVLQTNVIAASKTKYGSIKSIDHSITHGFLTFVVLVWFVPFQIAVYAQLIDIFVHYHVDYAKAKLSKDVSPSQKKYWTLFGADQLLHALTYIALVWMFI